MRPIPPSAKFTTNHPRIGRHRLTEGPSVFFQFDQELADGSINAGSQNTLTLQIPEKPGAAQADVVGHHAVLNAGSRQPAGTHTGQPFQPGLIARLGAKSVIATWPIDIILMEK